MRVFAAKVFLFDVTLFGPLVLLVIGGRHKSHRDRTNHAGSLDQKHQTDQRPIFKSTAKNLTVGPGDRAVLKCRIENLGTKTVTWKKSDEVHPLTIGLFPFAPDTRISVDFNQRTNEWSLVIQDVRPMDDGVYQCQISTKDDQESYDIRLNVKNIQLSGTQYVERGGTIQLMCNATGKPDLPHDVEWYKGTNRITSDAQNGIFITKKIETKVLVSVLVIKSSQPSDGGEYACKSSNYDTGVVTVQVVSVATVEKRGTSLSEKMIGGTAARSRAVDGDSLTEYHLRLLLTSLLTATSAVSFIRSGSIVSSH